MKKTIAVFWITSRYLLAHRHKEFIDSLFRAQWAREILRLFNIKTEVRGVVSDLKPMIFIANHISYIDIPLLMSEVGDLVFVSKIEVKKWPILGQASQQIETIFIERSCRDSRDRGRRQIIQSLLDKQKRIVIFPSGTTTVDNEMNWKKGIFEIAHELNLPIQPIRIRYSKPRIVAYVENDQLFSHIVNLSRHTDIRAELEFHPPIMIQNVLKDIECCRRWCNGKDEVIHHDLSLTKVNS